MNGYEAFGLFMAIPAAIGFCLRRAVGPYQRSAAYQRARWRTIAHERGLMTSGRAHEYVGTWGSLVVVLDTSFVPAETLWLRLRVLGVTQPDALLRRLRAAPSFARWRLSEGESELQLTIPFRGNALGAADLEAWLDAIREEPIPRSAYRN